MTEGERFSAILRDKCRGFIDLTAAQSDALWAHYELMCRWNPRINLTSVIELEKAAVRHYAESLFLASLVPAGTVRVADIGSGAGFPGFPVAVALPKAEVFLIESDQRKAAFLREASDLCRNVRVRCVRSDAYKDQVDAVVGRAVRPAEIISTARRVANWYGILLSRQDADQIAATSSAQVTVLPWDTQSAALTCTVPRGTSETHLRPKRST
jgi:16S rRNA (guanine(527)-N(7))-methyltransferase RsmG